MKFKKSKFNYYFKYKGDNYLYNTYTSSLAILDQEDFKIEEPYIEDLVNNGYIVESDKDEVQSLINEINEYTNKSRKELDITVILTEMCNFQCLYCYQTKNIHVFTKEDADELIKQVEHLYEELDIVNVHYFGGEPLLNLEILKYLDKKLKEISSYKNKIYNSFITTNGSLLTKTLIEDIGFHTFYLTFDGNKNWQNKLKLALIDSYENNFKIIKEILNLSRSNINIRFNVCKENHKSFTDTIKEIILLEEYDPERVKFEITPLKKLTKDAKFEELNPEEYARVHLELCFLLKNNGVKLYLPRPLSEPCKYLTGNAVCMGPNMKLYYCSSNDTIIYERTNLLKHINNKNYKHQIPTECVNCKVLPLCIHSCGLLKEEGTACIPEKFILKDILSDYLQYPETWKE